MNRKIQIYDTTLRDGTQAEMISFSAEDKLHIAKRLDEFGIDYIEGGWPGSNPKDLEFFKLAGETQFKHARIVAFGSTKRAKNTVAEDPNIRYLLEAETPTVAIFGKSWILHVEKALRITPEENLTLISESVAYLKSKGKEVIYDAEHFFDGYKDNADYAVRTLQAAQNAGANSIALCDTNGGTLPAEISRIIKEVLKTVKIPLGIHTHNDSGLAVANSLVAVDAGCIQVQGTINGYGERAGNADLCSIIPNLQLKAGYQCIPPENMNQLTLVSRYVSEIANLAHPNNLPFTGKSAFAHKGGVHVSAVMKDPHSYEHIQPESVGNSRRVLVSDLSGQSNIVFKARELHIDLARHQEKIPEIVARLKELEHLGYQYEAAEGSLELLISKVKSEYRDFFNLKGFRILIEKNETGELRSEATIRMIVDHTVEHAAAEGDGPVNALDNALRKALAKFYPEINGMKLSDYKVRVLNPLQATAAKVRVLIESSSNGETWGTIGVSENIIEASWQALTESISYFLMQKHKHNSKSTESNHA
ncbi:MAG: citramalate synthase [Candidatus Marinimicrobia bacterium]|nr:citramalate synthase [Candidatus Neomarinimicrobiota bacterium]